MTARMTTINLKIKTIPRAGVMRATKRAIAEPATLVTAVILTMSACAANVTAGVVPPAAVFPAFPAIYTTVARTLRSCKKERTTMKTMSIMTALVTRETSMMERAVNMTRKTTATATGTAGRMAAKTAAGQAMKTKPARPVPLPPPSHPSAAVAERHHNAFNSATRALIP
jgi:hypothetical protein